MVNQSTKQSMKSRPSWKFWRDYTHGYKYAGTPEKKRNLVLASLDRSGFGWQIVFVAGFGFLTDAYDIFSINTIIPMISIVYYQGEDNFPKSYRLGLNLATLLGSMLGQVVLGYFGDRLGRRKVYGLELFFTIFASFGLATASSGAFDSMSFIGLLIFWRAVMGIGIGADYPLSAVITAESAPAAWRDSMLAAVFFCQPFGQLIAVLIAFAATAGMRAHIANIMPTEGALSCSLAATDPAAIECAKTVDGSWRLVAGLGAVPALIAIYFRWTIPETVYYSLDVTKNADEAMYDRKFFDPDDVDPEEEEDHVHDENQGSNPDDFTGQVRHPRDSAYSERGGTRSSHSAYAEDETQESGLLAGFWAHFITNGNLPDLLATSLNWMLLDFTFYLLGVNTSSFIPTLFGENVDRETQSPYPFLVNEERHIMESSSVGSMVGSLIAIAILLPKSKEILRGLTSPRRLQISGFIVLAGLFVIVGAMYMTLTHTNAHVAIVVFYELCQLFFNLGPNTTTFLIPAQSFPTRYRCLSYGISAALGKLGSVLGQIIVVLVSNNTKLGGTLIGLALVMLVGALSSWLITPETCDRKGASFELDDLGKGIVHRKTLAKGKGPG